MSKLQKTLGYIAVTVSLISLSTTSSCKKDDEDVCYSCTKAQKAQSPTVVDFCYEESKAEVTKSNYEAQGFVCSEK